MRIAIIACQIFTRELSYVIAHSDNIVFSVFLPQQYHNTPEKLNIALQQEIDKIEDFNYEHEGDRPAAIVLGYGLCSNAVLNLKSKFVPLIIPRTDDCIALFLSSQKRYQNLFNEYSGTYWYTPSWIEQTQMPSQDRYEKLYSEYLEKYGEDNAQFLLEYEHDWIKNYKHCAFISSPIIDNKPFVDFTKKCATELNWNFLEFTSSLEYFEKIVNGPWDDEHFLVAQPNNPIVASFDDSKIKI